MSFLLFVFESKTGSMGVHGHKLLYHVQQAGTARRFLNHESIGTLEFSFIRLKSMRERARLPSDWPFV